MPGPAEIRALRHRYGLTQAAFGRLIGAATRTVEDWEGSRRNMPAAKWELLQIKLRRRIKRVA